jgi:hypothetical protein
MKHWSKEDAAFFEARNREIYYRKAKGVTYAALAKEYGMGRERIRQIVESYKRRDVGKCRHCHPQHFWIGDLFFGDYWTVNTLHPYEYEEHEPIEMMADVVYKRHNPAGHAGKGWRDYPTAVEEWLAGLANPRVGVSR